MRPGQGIYKEHMKAGTKPPVHFHRYQYESFQVIGTGDFTAEIDGKERRIKKGDPAVTIPPLAHHVVYGTPGFDDQEIEFTFSSRDKRGNGQDVMKQYLLDRMFFENWYGYQEEVFQGKAKFDFIQILSVWALAYPLTGFIPSYCACSLYLRYLGGLTDMKHL
jgi:hypothetical protein